MRYLLLDKDKVITQDPTKVMYILVDSYGESESIFRGKLFKTVDALRINKSVSLTPEYYDMGIYIAKVYSDTGRINFCRLTDNLVDLLKIGNFVRRYTPPFGAVSHYYKFPQEEDK